MASTAELLRLGSYDARWVHGGGAMKKWAMAQGRRRVCFYPCVWNCRRDDAAVQGLSLPRLSGAHEELVVHLDRLVKSGPVLPEREPRRRAAAGDKQ